MAVLSYCSTPFSRCSLSPAEWLMVRCIRGNIPILTSQLVPNWDYLYDFRQQNMHFKDKQKQDYDHKHGVWDLAPIPEGTVVWITEGDQRTTGTVLQPANTLRSYIMNIPSGQVRHNQQHFNVVPQDHSPTRPTYQKQDNHTRDPIITRSRSGTIIHPPDKSGSQLEKGGCGIGPSHRWLSMSNYSCCMYVC